MRSWLWLAVVPGCLVSSCEKLREAADKASGKANEESGQSAGGIAQPGGEASEALQALVDFNESGYRFRRDLPFPETLTVRRDESLEISGGRLFGRSALGTGSAPIEGTIEKRILLTRDRSKVSINIEEDRLVKPIIEGEGEEAGQAEDARANELGESLAGLGATFIRREDGWQLATEQSDFRVMAWAKTLRPQLDDYLKGTGVVANTPWFGSQRMLAGVSVELTGKETALLLGEGGRGKLQLRFDRVENIDGHPCAVFRWSGEFTISDAASLSGERENVEMSVSAGQAWCSLLHPVILRREHEGVMTIERRGAGGELTMRLQGAVKGRTSTQWKPEAE